MHTLFLSKGLKQFPSLIIMYTVAYRETLAVLMRGQARGAVNTVKSGNHIRPRN